MATTMVPDASLLPQVFPTDKLNAKGMPTGELRTELRRVASYRNVLTLVGVWVQTVGLLIGTAVVVRHTGWWPLWIPVFVLMGRGHGLFGILGHESAHRMLFANQRANDLAGEWLVSAPTFVSQAAYRRSHMAHHRAALGPEEPDKTLYAEYPITKASFRRKLRRDLFGESGYKLMKALLKNLAKPIARPAVLRIIGVQIILAVVLGLTVGWWAWPVLWLAPEMSVWRVINRLRAIAEHGGMVPSDDERLISHHCDQHWIARFWMVPFHTGWHLAHHVDARVTWRNLPRFHAELVAAGYVVPGLTYPSYTALWRRLTSRDATETAPAVSLAAQS